MPGILLIIACAALWATDALFRMPLTQTLSAGTIVLCEHCVAAVVMLPWFLVCRRELGKLKASGWWATAFIGIVGSALGTFLFTQSFRFISPSVVIILQKLQPAVTVVGARYLLNEKPKKSFYGWAIVALIGAAMVALPERTVEVPAALHPLFIGCGLALGAAVCWGLSTVFGKLAAGRASFPVVSFLRIGWGLAGILVLSLVGIAPAPLPPHFDAALAKPILYIALLPGVLATYLYYAGLKRTRAAVATFAELFFPVGAVLLNWWFLGLTLNLTQLIGMAVLSVSVFFISREMRYS